MRALYMFRRKRAMLVADLSGCVAKLRFGKVVPACYVRVSALCCPHPAHLVSDDVVTYMPAFVHMLSQL